MLEHLRILDLEGFASHRRLSSLIHPPQRNRLHVPGTIEIKGMYLLISSGRLSVAVSGAEHPDAGGQSGAAVIQGTYAGGLLVSCPIVATGLSQRCLRTSAEVVTFRFQASAHARRLAQLDGLPASARSPVSAVLTPEAQLIQTNIKMGYEGLILASGWSVCVAHFRSHPHSRWAPHDGQPPGHSTAQHGIAHAPSICSETADIQ